MHERKLLEIDLKLFDGTAGGASEGASAEGATAQVDSGLPKAERRGSSRHNKSGEFDNVVFGKQDDDSTPATSTPAAEGKGEGNTKTETSTITPEERRQAFEDLISGEYKDLYTEKFQKALNQRLKKVNGMEESLNAQKPIMDMLSERYGITDGDASKLLEAIESDTAYWEEIAEEQGLTVEQYKAVKKLERENAEFRQMQRMQQGEADAQRQLNEWYTQGEALKELYPTFDLQAEAQNRDFLDLLKSGLPIQKAYELIHMEEIKQEAARNAARTAGQQMAARVKEKASRPKENGMSSQSAVIVKNDVSNLTRAERAEIVRRVQRGENIKF